MGIDRNSGSDKPPKAEKPDAPPVPPDNPGSPGQRSRLESRSKGNTTPETEIPVPTPAEPPDDRVSPKTKPEAGKENDLDQSSPSGDVSQAEDAATAVEDRDPPADSSTSQVSELEGHQPDDEPSEQADSTADTDALDEKDQDEPGSWRGDGGRYISADHNRQVGEEYKEISLKEPEITSVQEKIESTTPEAELVGREQRLKGEERFKEKVADAIQVDFRDDPRAAARNVCDAIRYTYQIPADSYVQTHQAITEKLTQHGYELTFRRNSWANPEYKGINTRWRTPEGQNFEVQFHTPESFEAKKSTHAAYEKLRSPSTSGQQVAEVKAYQREISGKVPVPTNIADVPADYKKAKDT